MNKNIDNILKYGSYLLVFILPIFHIKKAFFPYISPKNFLFYGLVEILVTFWIYAWVDDPSYRLSKRTLLYFLPLFCFIAWMSIAGILAVSPGLSFWSSIARGTGLLTLYHCLVFGLMISSLVKRNGSKYLNKLMHWFLNGGLILALSVWFGNEGFNAFSSLKDSLGGGFLGNSSLAAAYLMFALAFGFFLLVSKEIKKQNKWWIGVKMAVILFSPLFVSLYGVFTGHGILGSARGATLGLVVATLVAATWRLLISSKKSLKTLGIIIMVVGLAVFTIGWYQLVKPNTWLHQKFTETASGTRFVFDEISQKSMIEHPWFGYGPENYMIAFQEHFNPKMALPEYGYEVWTDRAHNFYYDIGVSGGYPAVALYLLFVISIFFAIFKLNNKKIGSELQLSILAGLIAGYLFQNLFVFDSLLSIMAVFVVAGIVFAGFSISEDKEFKAKTIKSLSKNVIALVLAVTCLATLFFFVIRPVKKVSLYYKVFFLPIDVRKDHLDGLLKGSSIGEQWDVGGIIDHTFNLYGNDLEKIKNDKKLLPYAIGDIQGIINYAEKVAEKNPNDERLYISIASFYNALNYFGDRPYDPKVADHILGIINNAIRISPQNPNNYWIMAQVYMWKGDIKEVENLYQKAIDLDPSIPEFHDILIRFTKQIKDEKAYNEAILQAEKDIPGFIFNQ